MLSITTELSKFAPTQTTLMGFNSYCKVGYRYLAADSDGLYAIYEGEDANGTNIDSYFKLVRTDFGIANHKRLRAAYIGYEASGNLKLTITVDEKFKREFTLAPQQSGQLQHGIRVPLTRDLRGRYFEFKFENVSGCDFSIDSVKLIATVLGMTARAMVRISLRINEESGAFHLHASESPVL